jgi:hypothetical protein
MQIVRKILSDLRHQCGVNTYLSANEATIASRPSEVAKLIVNVIYGYV